MTGSWREMVVFCSDWRASNQFGKRGVSSGSGAGSRMVGTGYLGDVGWFMLRVLLGLEGGVFFAAD